MKSFWPKRANAKGFSIENLARKYCEKISKNSQNKVSNYLLSQNHIKVVENPREYLIRSSISVERRHWANRDFSEYRKSA